MKFILVLITILVSSVWAFGACSNLAKARDVYFDKVESQLKTKQGDLEKFHCSATSKKKICTKTQGEIASLQKELDPPVAEGFIDNAISKAKSTFWFGAHTCKWTIRVAWDWPIYLWDKLHWGVALFYWLILFIGVVRVLAGSAWGTLDQADFNATNQLLQGHRQLNASFETNNLLGKLLKK